MTVAKARLGPVEIHPSFRIVIVHHSEHKRYNIFVRCTGDVIWILQARYTAEDSSLLALISGREDEGGKVYSPKWRRAGLAARVEWCPLSELSARLID
jgi:hypothetical protein